MYRVGPRFAFDCSWADSRNLAEEEEEETRERRRDWRDREKE